MSPRLEFLPHRNTNSADKFQHLPEVPPPGPRTTLKAPGWLRDEQCAIGTCTACTKIEVTELPRTPLPLAAIPGKSPDGSNPHLADPWLLHPLIQQALRLPAPSGASAPLETTRPES